MSVSTTKYPIHHFDVSKHNDRPINSSADIEIRFNLGSNFRNIANNADQPFYVHAIIQIVIVS